MSRALRSSVFTASISSSFTARSEQASRAFSPSSRLSAATWSWFALTSSLRPKLVLFGLLVVALSFKVAVGMGDAGVANLDMDHPSIGVQHALMHRLR